MENVIVKNIRLSQFIIDYNRKKNQFNAVSLNFCSYFKFKFMLQYISKVTVEFSIFFVRKLTTLRTELKDSSSYSKFKVENQDIEI